MTHYIRIDTQRFMVSLWEQYYLIIREFVLNMCMFYNKYDGRSFSFFTKYTYSGLLSDARIESRLTKKATEVDQNLFWEF